MSYAPLQTIIEQAFAERAQYSIDSCPKEVLTATEQCLALLDSGTLRIAEKRAGEWHTHTWLKQAVLLYFKLHDNQLMHSQPQHYYDKVPLKYADWTREQFLASGTRVVPPATVRKGAYVAPNTVLMPSYINVGAYVDSGTLIDTWATVGSCAQIGKNVHLSGGAGIGGVLEPLQANPVIIEDNCFIGARSEIVEGVIVEQNAVISMGVYLGQSTKIYDRETGEIHRGRVPAGSVVVPGSLPAKNGQYHLYAAIIVKKVDAQTLDKVQLNEILREIAE